MAAAPMPAPLSAREPERLAALERLRILDTPAEEAFDRITRLAAQLFGMPIALVSLLDEKRQWLKSRYGTEADYFPREIAFCAHTILGDRPMVVPDAAADARFADTPLVARGPKLRFYAGAPLLTADGLAVGTVCVIDYKPHADFDERKQQVLRDLADLAMERLEVREITLALQKRESQLTAALEDREALLREIHHRVKNNLQAIASIVQVEAARLPQDDPARHKLEAVDERIAVMFRIHQQLYSTGELSLVDLSHHLKELAAAMGELHAAKAGVRIEVDAEPQWLDADTALRIGLIANELLANSLKHAFSAKAGGAIRIRHRQLPGRGMVLTVHDRIGSGPRVTASAKEGVGYLLVRALAQQIGAQVSVSPDPGGWKVEVRMGKQQGV